VCHSKSTSATYGVPPELEAVGCFILPSAFYVVLCWWVSDDPGICNENRLWRNWSSNIFLFFKCL